MSKPGENHVQKILKTYRDSPVDSGGLDDNNLVAIFVYLMDVLPNAAGEFHWFCKHASDLTREAATFLIRLRAYNGEHVQRWGERLHICLRRCAACVQGLEVAKVSSRSTYLAAYDQHMLEPFFKQFEESELQALLKDIEQTDRPSHTATKASLSEQLSSAVIYRMVSNWTIFSDPRIQDLLQTNLLIDVTASDWPTNPLPPGLFVLLLHENEQVRKWAALHAARSKLVSHEQLIGSYAEALAVIGYAAQLGYQPATNSGLPQPTAISQNVVDVASRLPFARGSAFWSGFEKVLRSTPPEWLKSSPGYHIDLRRIVLNHLHVREASFVEIFQCFYLLLKRLHKQLWIGDGPEYPQVVFDAVKDNPRFTELLQAVDSLGPGSPPVMWIPEYLSTIRTNSVFDEMFARIINFLVEEAQHERFRDARLPIMKTAIIILQDEFRRYSTNSDAQNRSPVLKILDIHAEVIVSVGYGAGHGQEKWADTRQSARTLINEALGLDVASIYPALKCLFAILGLAKRDQPYGHEQVPIISIRKQLWSKLYPTLQAFDCKGLANLACVAAKSAHLAPLETHLFKEQWKLPAGDRALEEINKSLRTFQDGFLDAVSRFSNFNMSSAALDVLQCQGAGQSIMLLLLSPLEDYQVAAQTLVGLAFDVDGRQECFRALLENLSDEALNGIFNFLEIFNRYASLAPEACNLAKALVRCFTDVLDVLCTKPHGLLQSSIFLRAQDNHGPAARMPKFWKLMTKALCTIFKRTPMWAQHFEVRMMTEWMRDALILARDMLNYWTVIETAANMALQTRTVESNKLSTVGEQMIQALQEFFPELTRWLRLTDEELLHQSFTLLNTLLALMKECHVRPSTPDLDKLGKHVQSAMETRDNVRDQKTRLDSARLSQLASVLREFDDDGDDDDDVEIVAHHTPRKEQPQPKPTTAPRPYIQGKTSKTASSRPVQTRLPQLLPPKASSSKVFTSDDQKKLDHAAVIPSFRKTGTSSLTSGSGQTSRSIEPKNEAAAGAAESDESSGSESDEEPHQTGGLASLGKFVKSPRKSPARPKLPIRRPIKILDLDLPKKPVRDRTVVSQKDKVARIRPNISGLHKTLLSWDYNDDGPVPPGDKLKFSHIPDRFDNYDHFFRVFEPLLLLECWAQLQQSKEEKQDIFQCVVESRRFVDSWIDVGLVISDNIRRDWYLAETDVVLLHHPGHNKRIMAKVMYYKATARIEVTVRCNTQDGPGDPGLQMQTHWQINKLFSLSTLHREYGALISLRYNDICGDIMRPSLTIVPEVDSRALREAMVNYKVNEPQAIAILKVMETRGFSLIQGPPGTGKTSTICGLVARFMSTRSRPPVPIMVGLTNSTTRSGNQLPTERSGSRILLCAPSNAAIDEIANRIKDGYIGSEKQKSSINVVRIGADQAINTAVRQISLESLVDQKLEGSLQPLNETGNDLRTTQAELDGTKQKINDINLELQSVHDNSARKSLLQKENETLQARRRQLRTKLDKLRDKRSSVTRSLDTLRRNARLEVLSKADVVCSTLSGSGHEILESLDFEMIIIDEAAQAIEPSSLIPLKYETKRCVMVGDPQQLPPTVISQESSRFGYNQSLFVRLQKSQKDAVHLLSIQYRMHPEISRLPSALFYHKRLLDGPDMTKKTSQPWHGHPKFGTYKFLNIAQGIEEQSGRSIKNFAECRVAVALFNRLRLEFATVNFNSRVGIVSMYRAQIGELRRQFEQHFGKEIVSKIDFNTVDGFQGQEKDVIILSCVRAGPGLQTVGFLADTRRMNVALTRAKSSLFILGNARTLERSDDTWREIITDARSRSALIDADATYFTRPASPTHPMAHPPPKKPRLANTSVPTQPAQPAQPPPLDLATPQAFKAAVDAGPSAGSRQPVVPRPVPSPSQVATNNITAAGTKRPADNEAPAGSTSSRPLRTDPPRKRPKPAQSIFIPKNNKRK